MIWTEKKEAATGTLADVHSAEGGGPPEMLRYSFVFVLNCKKAYLALCSSFSVDVVN